MAIQYSNTPLQLNIFPKPYSVQLVKTKN
jgi:hypothetical protein